MEKNTVAIIFIGRSGCGKGTQSKLLIEFFAEKGQETLYLSTGNEFRNLIAEGDNFTSKKVDQIYDAGGRHPDFLCVTILGNFFKNQYDANKNLIMDGGLRSLNEAQTVADIFDFYEIKNAKVFNLDVSHEWSVDKLKKRGRDDDNDTVFEAKKKWYEDEVIPAIEFLKKNNKFEFHIINGENSVEEVHRDIISKLNG